MVAPAVDRELLELAVTVAHRAGGVAAERFFEADFATRAKRDGSDVTDVDLAVEELIRAELLRHTPDDEVYGEEGGTVAGSSGRRWIIDPIDGTTYFANRIPLWGNLIAYEDEHGPAIGVINEPVAQRMIFAGRGLGCWVRTAQDADRRPTLRGATELRRARTELVNIHSWHTELLMTLHQNVVATGHLGGIAGVLTGLLDAVVVAGGPMEYQDLAPLPVILHEAGGRVSDLSGGPLLSGPGTILVSTGHLHEELLNLVAGLPHGQRPDASGRQISSAPGTPRPT
jgi:histidinol-phosphatase